MEEKIPELRVIRARRDGRRKFDEQSKRALVEACLKPGVSVARMAQTYGVNANLLRKWIARYLMEREQSWGQPAQQAAPVVADDVPNGGSVDGVYIDVPVPAVSDPAASKSHAVFVPVVAAPAPLTVSSQSTAMAIALHVRLPNGVEFDLGKANIEELTTVVQLLGRLPCSGSTTS
ncbi:MAG: transposase [Longimicrobiales bacterium]